MRLDLRRNFIGMDRFIFTDDGGSGFVTTAFDTKDGKLFCHYEGDLSTFPSLVATFPALAAWYHGASS